MQNDLLKSARAKRFWSIEKASGEIGIDPCTYKHWERGDYNPQLYNLDLLCKAFHAEPEELGYSISRTGKVQLIAQPQLPIIAIEAEQKLFVPSFTNGYTEEEDRDWATWFGVKQAQLVTMINAWGKQTFMFDEIQTVVDQEIKMMDETLNQYEALEKQSISRRQALITIAALPTTLLAYKHSLAPDTISEEFIPQCSASITACWHLLKGKGLSAVSEILPKYIPLLTTIALRPSKHQKTAAQLATQTSILQAIIAMHRLNFTAREAHCKDAIRYSRISGDNKLQAAAFMYLGYTLSFCYQPRRPEKAIPIFLEALNALGNDNSLIKSDILMGLGEAYAQCNDEKNALHYLGLAQTYFPSDPELDPSYMYAECGLTTLYQWEGKTYLELMEYVPDKGYQQKASNSLMQSIGASSLSERCTNETIIYQADAARALGELEVYSHSLTQAATMAIEIGSKKRYNEALQVYQKTPEKWLSEPLIIGIGRDIFRQLPRAN